MGIQSSRQIFKLILENFAAFWRQQQLPNFAEFFRGYDAHNIAASLCALAFGSKATTKFKPVVASVQLLPTSSYLGYFQKNFHDRQFIRPSVELLRNCLRPR